MRKQRAKFFGLGLLILLLGLGAIGLGQGAFPDECNDWATLESPQDGAETFCNQDQHVDVIETHWFADADYLYLRMCLRAHGGWPVIGNPSDPYDEARYKWFIDTNGCDMSRPGGQVSLAEFLVFVEDYGSPDDGLGEMYLIDDTDGANGFNEWEVGSYVSPPPPTSTYYRSAAATGQTPGATNQVSNSGDTADIGFEIDGPDPGTLDNDTGCCTYTVDMYVKWSALGLAGPTDVCVMWAAETESPNLDAAEVCDRHNDSTPLVGDANTGTIVIAKDANPADGTDFSFDGTGGLGAFTLDDDTDGTLSDTATFEDLAPGTYDVTETVPDGWKIDAISCCDCDPASGNTTASISVGPDQTVQCIFTNEQIPVTTGTITVVKDSLPEAAQDFDFTFTPPVGSPVTFSLDDADPDDSDGVFFSRVFPDLEPGTYTITETVPAGWTLASITNDNDSNPANGVTVDLSAGESVIVTFNNAKKGTIIVAKNSIPDDDRDFTFSGDLGGFTLDDEGTKEFADLAPGTYTIYETDPGGLWALETITITDGSGTVQTNSATINLLPGETITATFVNQKLVYPPPGATIIVVKDSIPDDDEDFTFSMTGQSDFTLDDDDDGTHSFSKTFTGLLSGTYEIVEGAVSGWNLTDITIDGGTSPTTNLTERRASVVIFGGAAGVAADVVTVTFTNELEPPATGSIVIVKDSIPDDVEAFTFSMTGQSDFTLDDDGAPPNSKTFGNLAPGDYTVSEAVPAGWSVEEILCTHADPVTGSNQVDIDLVAGELVTCVFTNVKREPLPGTIIVTKNAVPDSTQNFAFAGDLGGFTLDNPSADDGDAYGFEKAFFDVAPGQYTVSEIVPANWVLTGVGIAGTSGTVDLAAGSATVYVGDRTVTTIAFTNTENPPAHRPPPPPGGGGNEPPFPVLGEDRVVCVGELVCLDGSRSYDRDALPGAANGGVQYSWTFSVLYVAGGVPVYKIPDGSLVVGTIQNADTATPCFVPDLPGTYALLLTVTDDDGATAFDEISVTADPCDTVQTCCIEEGWNLYSPPLHTADLGVEALVESIGTDAPVWTYEGAYRLAESLSPFGGYWVRAEAFTCFETAGMVPDEGTIPLGDAGWHLIGVPFAVRWENVVVRFHSVEMTMNDAVRRGFVSAYAYCYDPIDGRYSRSDTLLPCQGYWVESHHEGIELRLYSRFALAGPADGCTGRTSNDPPDPPVDAASVVPSVQVMPVPASTEARFVVRPVSDIRACRVVIFDVARHRVWEGEAVGLELIWPLVRSDGSPAADGPYVYVVEVEIEGSWRTVGRGVLFVKR